jgi:hypothetical protein
VARRIALRVHLHAVVSSERFAQGPPMFRKRVRVRIAQLVQQPRRALDVREQKRDRPGRELTHTAMMRRN